MSQSVADDTNVKLATVAGNTYQANVHLDMGRDMAEEDNSSDSSKPSNLTDE